MTIVFLFLFFWSYSIALIFSCRSSWMKGLSLPCHKSLSKLISAVTFWKKQIHIRIYPFSFFSIPLSLVIQKYRPAAILIFPFGCMFQPWLGLPPFFRTFLSWLSLIIIMIIFHVVYHASYINVMMLFYLFIIFLF